MTSPLRRSPALSRAIWAIGLAVAVLSTLLLVAALPAFAAEAPGVPIDPSMARWAFVAAALSTALSALGAGYAVARVGSAAIGAIAEKPELFGRVLVLVGLAEGIAIYGLIVSILILNRVS